MNKEYIIINFRDKQTALIAQSIGNKYNFECKVMKSLPEFKGQINHNFAIRFLFNGNIANQIKFYNELKNI